MVLTFNNSLFKTQGLEQDTGLLKSRWAQDGSSLKSFNITIGGADATVYTVTAGKRLHIDYIVYVINPTSSAETCYLRDGTGGTIKFSFNLPANPTNSLNFTLPTPIYFDTSLYFDQVGTAGSGEIYLTGWEEDAP